MYRFVAAALALTTTSSLQAQSIADQTYAVPLPGSWAYAATADGSEAVFFDANNNAQLRLRCSRSTRRVTLSKPGTAPVATLDVWSSTRSKSLAASFDPATARVNAVVANWDPLLDALAYSRGRFAVAVPGQQPLVVPAWADISRVIEDCRV